MKKEYTYTGPSGYIPSLGDVVCNQTILIPDDVLKKLDAEGKVKENKKQYKTKG